MRSEDTGPNPHAQKRRRASLQAIVGGWVLILGGAVYAFQFESAIGWVACAFGAGLLSIKDAKTLLGK